MPSKQFFKRLGVRPLALRLLAWVLLYSVVLSLVATGAQMHGELAKVSSFQQFYDEVLGQALHNLWFQSIVVMLGTLGLLLIVRITLFRHLETMADYAARLNLDALVDPLKLRRKAPKRPDELSELEQALNRMRLQILEDTRSLRQDTLKSRDERDEAIRANHAKNQFLANVSHELRIPLQSVLGYANLLTDTPLDQEQREYVNTLLGASENLSAIINDLLDISAMEAGKMELEAIPFDLRETLNDLIHMLGSRAREKGLALEVRVDENLPWALVGDPVRIRQVMLNLLSNAIKFTDSGTVELRIQCLADKVLVLVQDSGRGIPLDEQSRVFEEYHQVFTHHRQQGVGLGLSVVKRLAVLLQLDLQLESVPGAGTTFRLVLPKGDPALVARQEEVSGFSLQGCRVLVVDDDPALLEATCSLLAEWGCEVMAADGKDAALAHADASVPPQIIVSDYHLQGCTGLSVIRAVQSCLDQPVPAVLMSGDTSPQLVQNMRDNALFLLKKPVKPVHLRKVLRQLLQQPPVT
ncbi:MAG TPA: hypothetical protein DD667_15595 [Gammaproteobacteria bacterium]|nr:hypothetical protein [Gammaproteobacteria bacterium]